MIVFSFAGQINHKTKNRYPIPYGDKQALVRRITCDIQARLAKFSQADASKNEVYYYTIIFFFQNWYGWGTLTKLSNSAGVGPAQMLLSLGLGIW